MGWGGGVDFCFRGLVVLLSLIKLHVQVHQVEAGTLKIKVGVPNIITTLFAMPVIFRVVTVHRHETEFSVADFPFQTTDIGFNLPDTIFGGP